MPLIPIESLGPSTFTSPLRYPIELKHGGFVPDHLGIRHSTEVDFNSTDGKDLNLVFEKAGPRAKLFFNPSEASAAIVTCGGLCPGLNNVIRSLYYELYFNYKVAQILGIRHGFQGLNPEQGMPPVWLDRKVVSQIHNDGGTFLGTSRGSQDPKVMVDFLQVRGINLFFGIGGDGTQRGNQAIHNEAKRRGYPLAVVGIPKTIDNDIQYCDRSFGLMTAIDKAREVIRLAHTEATGNPRGIGLVKVMGREAGFIACGATLASQEVNFTLIPESPFDLDGEYGLLKALEHRMNDRGHAVIVIAEGAGQDLFEPSEDKFDASGNHLLSDIGPLLKGRILEHFNRIGEPVDLKYIDPSYIVRSVPANSEDALLCDALARRAVDAAMAGRTNLFIAPMNSSFAHVPITMTLDAKRRVALDGWFWNSVISATGQAPQFRTPRS